MPQNMALSREKLWYATLKTMKKVVDHFTRVDPMLAPLIAAGFAHTSPIQLRQPVKADLYFAELAESVMSQQLSIKAAATIWKRFVELLGGKVTPETILKHTPETLRTVGVSRQKSGYLLAMAEGVRSGRVKLDHLNEMSDEQVIEELTKLKGVGAWTAEMFLMFSLGRPDVFSYLDLGLLKAFEQVYKLANPTREVMEPIVTNWKPYRTYAALALWHSRDS